MNTVIITRLKKAESALLGMSVPKQYNGNIGKLVENIMAANNYEMSN